jgi:hypothetical protein
MNPTETPTPRYFKFSKEADAELTRQAAETGKPMKTVLEDLLLGRRQFASDVEVFLREESGRTGLSRKQIVEVALTRAARESSNPRTAYTTNQTRKMALNDKPKKPSSTSKPSSKLLRKGGASVVLGMSSVFFGTVSGGVLPRCCHF